MKTGLHLFFHFCFVSFLRLDCIRLFFACSSAPGLLFGNYIERPRRKVHPFPLFKTVFCMTATFATFLPEVLVFTAPVASAGEDHTSFPPCFLPKAQLVFSSVLRTLRL